MPRRRSAPSCADGGSARSATPPRSASRAPSCWSPARAASSSRTTTSCTHAPCPGITARPRARVLDRAARLQVQDVQPAAAFGLAQLERVDELIEMKRGIFDWYREDLDGLPGITLNHETDWARSIYWMSSIRVGGLRATDGMRAALAAQGIDTRPVFPPISQYPIWAERRAPADRARDRRRGHQPAQRRAPAPRAGRPRLRGDPPRRRRPGGPHRGLRLAAVRQPVPQRASGSGRTSRPRSRARRSSPG